MKEEMKKKERLSKTKMVFVMIPFTSDFRPVYEVLKEAADDAAERTGFVIRLVRADEIRGSNIISDALQRTIRESDLVIADLSRNRPNVMYELGIAHALQKPVILVASETDFLQRPFDISGFLVNVYGGLKSLQSFRQSLSSKIIEALETPERFAFVAGPERDQGDTKPTVFISYSHVDKEYLGRLQVHLRPLIKQNRIELWDDTRIKAGEKWKEEVIRALDRAAIAVLLISADFLASDFIIDNELPPLLRSAEEKGTTILPLILKPCRFLRDRNLNVFQAINNPTEPLMKLSPGDQEDLYARVAERIENDLLVK
jgi:hypothetical protein